jgi:hypothetical protein
MGPPFKSKVREFQFPSFLGSVDFCESYAFPPIARVGCLLERTGEIRKLFCYQDRKWAGFFREIEIIGPIDPGNDLVQRLVTKHKPDLLTFSLQTARSFPEHAAGRRLLEVRQMAEDYRIDLPSTPEEYLRRLGKQTRKHLPYYLRRLHREWGSSYSVEMYRASEITWDSFVGVLDLNRQRLRAKGRVTGWTPRLAAHRWPLFCRNGLLVSFRLENKIAGATLSLLYGGEAYLIAIAHDPRHDHLSLGNICLWKTIEHLIGSGHTIFHLLWGQCFYKEQFGGRRVPLWRASYSSN